MKKKLLFILSVLLTTSMMAQVSKIPAGTRFYLEQLQSGNANTRSFGGKLTQREAKLFVSCAPDADIKAIEAQLEQIGAKPRGTIDRYVMVSAPASTVGQIADIPGVTYISKGPRISQKTIITKEVTGVSKAHSGAESLPQAFTGKDVVVGIIDGGIDFTHPAFRDAEGNLRIKAFYSPFVPSEDVDVPVVTLDGTVLVGKAYTKPEEILALGTDDDTDSHGTHTSSIAAGSTFGWAGGMAPDADIVFCSYTDYTDIFAEEWGYNVIQGIQYIRDYAKRVGKPYVISLSLNSHDGPHDGTGPITSILNQLARENTNIAICASNEGCDSCYVNHAFAANDTLHAIMRGPASYAYTRSPEEMSFQIGLFDRSTKTETWRSEPLRSGGGGGYFVIDFQNDVVEGEIDMSEDIYNNLNGIVTEGYLILCIENTEDGRAKLVFQHGDLPERYLYTLHIACPENSMVDLWGDSGTSFYGMKGSDYYARGTGRVSMGDFCTGGNLITIGSWVAKDSYTNIKGKTIADWTLPAGGSVGTYSYFSSYGTDLAGYSHPFVSTPGSSIVSAVSHYDANSFSELVYLVAQDDDGYPWATMSGTSMATPAAAGIIALWLEAMPDLTYQQIKEAIAATAITDEFTEAAPIRFGHGKMDAYKGLLYILGIPTSIPTLSQHQPAGVKFRLQGHTLYIDGADEGTPVRIYTTDGRLVTTATITGGSVIIPETAGEGVYAVQVGKLGSTLIRL